MDINKITEIIIGCAIEVHKQLGLPLIYKEIHLEEGYRLDLLVEDKVVVEVKAVEAISEVHTAQVLTYLKLSHAKAGLIINFNVLRLSEGIKRLIGRN